MPAIIGGICLIIGATIGYIGTQKSAQAQVESAKIGIYGPIYATQTAEAMVSQHTASLESESLAVEQIPLDVFAYAGNDNPDGGKGTFVLINDQNSKPTYKLDYFLPNDKPGFAGLAFNFHEGINLSTNNAIECMITFSQTNGEIDLYMKDIGNNYNAIRVANSGSNEMIVRYEFKNFPNINVNAVKEIGIVAKTDFTTGSFQVVIKNIRFVR